MITPKQYAEHVNARYSTVMKWLQKDLIPGAEKQELPSGGWYYIVPDDAPKPDLKPGPKPKNADSGVDQAEKTEAAAQTEQAPVAKPAKKAGKPVKAKKKAGSKK